LAEDDIGDGRANHHASVRSVFHDHRRALVYSSVLLLLTAGLLAVVGTEPADPVVQPIDDWWYEAMQRIRTPVATAAAEAFDVLGGVWVTLPLRVGVAIWLAFRRRWRALSAWVLTWALSEIVVTIAKVTFDRPRPPAPLVGVTGASFPSGHAAAAAATGVALVLVLLPAGPRRVKWEYLAVLLSFLMSLSRTYVNAHWFTDGLAGSLLGAGIAIGSAAVVSEVREITLRRKGHPRSLRAPWRSPRARGDP